MAPVEDDVEAAVDALFAADPEGFIAGRQALVKRLRAEGKRGAAAEVAGLRRPTAAAWAVNQLARRHGDELARLLAVGDELRAAHERLLAGGRDDAVGIVGRRRREAVSGLVDRAAAILAGSGRAADAHRDAIASTLDAASLDPAVAGDVAGGRLSKELEPPSGFGDEGAWTATPRTSPRTSPRAALPAVVDAEPAVDRSSVERARRADEARRKAETARTAATRARALADQARAAADHANRELDRLEDEVARARRTAVDSRRAARELRDAADEAGRQATALEREAGT